VPSQIKIEMNLKPLEKIQKDFKKKYIAKVGILGSSNSRQDNLSNAGIGAVHEFGSFKKKIPRRSFLKMPLLEKKKELLKTLSNLINKYLKDKNIKKIYKLLGFKAETIILRAFATKGFGKWEKLKNSTIKRKKSSAILIDTAQLRKSIISKVKG